MWALKTLAELQTQLVHKHDKKNSKHTESLDAALEYLITGLHAATG